MARRDALLRLHKTLVARRDELRKRLSGDLYEGMRSKSGDASGDVADLAFDNGSGEVSFQLAELESRELRQIELSLDKLRAGTYGVCEGCAKKIPVERLNALPFSSTCISCQRDMEMYGSWSNSRSTPDWGRVGHGAQATEDQREVKLSDLEFDMPSR